MGRISILHTANLHLGGAYLGLPSSAGGQLRKDIMQVLSGLAETCKEEQVDLMIISGGLWDNRYITRPLVDYICDQFRRIPATQVVIAPGERDYCGNNSFYNHYPWPNNVHIFTSSQLNSIWLPHLNTKIYGLGWTEPTVPKVNWQELQEASGQIVVVAHGEPASLEFPQSLMTKDDVYLALGGAKKQTAYSSLALDPGSPVAKGFEDNGTKGVFIGRIGQSSQLRFVDVSPRKFLIVNRDVTGEDAPTVAQGLNSTFKPQNLYRVVLTGQRDFSLDELRQSCKCFYLELVDETSCTYDIPGMLKEQRPTIIGQYIQEVQKKSPDHIKERALRWGLDALLEGGVRPW